MNFEKNSFFNFEAINLAMNKTMAGEEPLVNGKLKKRLPYAGGMGLADYLYDWGEYYLSDKKYKNAEVVLLKIVELNLWDEDETLKPGTYSLLASLYFNIAIKNHVSSKYKDKEFSKALECAQVACDCSINKSLENRTKLGAWQVQFCVNILLNNCMEACRLKAQHNINFMAERQRKPWDEKLNWYVGNEFGDTEIETNFKQKLKDFLYKNPEKFDDLFELHNQYKSAWNFTEELAFASSFIENNSSRRAILYNDLFEYVSIEKIGFDHYILLLYDKLGSEIFSDDKGQIKRTLLTMDKLKEEFEAEFNKLPNILRQGYSALRLYALIEIYDYSGAIAYAKSLHTNELTEQVLYCIANALSQLGEWNQAERAGIASLSSEIDVFKVQGMGKLYFNRMEYEKAYEMFKWGIEGAEKDIEKGERILGPKNIPQMGKPAKEILRELYSEVIDSLVMLNDFSTAKEYYNIYSEMQGATDKNQVLIKIERMEELYKDKQTAFEEKRQMQDHLLEKDKTIQEMVEMQHQWYNELLSCQILNQETEITDELWEQLSVGSRMDCIIKKINFSIEKSGSDVYAEKVNKVKERYPNLSQKAQRYLASAEQMFDVFSRNPLIDFAPVLVEFARVFEESLWNYLDSSDVYREAVEKQLVRYKKTLGTAAYVINNNPGPLRGYSQDIRDITNMRNESAHAYVSKEPQIKAIRNMIWTEKRTLLDEM